MYFVCCCSHFAINIDDVHTFGEESEIKLETGLLISYGLDASVL